MKPRLLVYCKTRTVSVDLSHLLALEAVMAFAFDHFCLLQNKLESQMLAMSCLGPTLFIRSVLKQFFLSSYHKLRKKEKKIFNFYNIEYNIYYYDVQLINKDIIQAMLLQLKDLKDVNYS